MTGTGAPGAADSFADVLLRYRTRTAKSRSHHAIAQQWIPGGINRNILYHAPYPFYIASGEGAKVVDIDGNELLDFNSNYSSLILGHGHPAVLSAVTTQMRHGSAWAGGSEDEAWLAKQICGRLAGTDQVRFTASGTEATLLAIRAARAFTGRPLIAKFAGGYHGQHDYVSVDNPAQAEVRATRSPVAAQGVPADVLATTVALPFNDHDFVRDWIDANAPRLAAVIVEPFLGVAGVIAPTRGFLHLLRSLTERRGVLLILDEIISFRSAFGGAQSLYDVMPDLTTLGKIIGGGYSIGAVAGRRAVMSQFDPSVEAGAVVNLSGTFHANPISLAAGCAALHVLSADAIAQLNRVTDELALEANSVLRRARRPLRLQCFGSVFNIHASGQPITSYDQAVACDKAFIAQLYVALLNEGVLLSPRGFGCVSLPMDSSHVARFVKALEASLKALRVL